MEEKFKYYKFGCNLFCFENMDDAKTVTYIKRKQQTASYYIIDAVAEDNGTLKFYEDYNPLFFISYTIENEISKEEFEEKWIRHPKFRKYV